MKRLPIVGVMGSGSERYADQAARLGRWLAKQDVHLLTGGGGGVMGAVSRAFYETPIRTGLVIGIVPGDPCRAGLRGREGYPNPWVEIPIFTHLALRGARGTEPMSRNHINVLSSDVLIALPGGQARLARWNWRLDTSVLSWPTSEAETRFRLSRLGSG